MKLIVKKCLAIVVFVCGVLSFTSLFQISYSQLASEPANSRDKMVILNFYDNNKNQFTNAKPILDKYGFKVTFFIVCNWAISDNSILTWQNITQLYARMTWQEVS